MNNEIVTVRNLVTRKVGKVRRSIAEHPIFGRAFEIVDDSAKSYVDLDELVAKKRPKPKPPVQETPEETDEKDEVEA